MENQTLSPKPKENQTHLPNSTTSSTSSSPTTTRPMTRPEPNNPYPTTFVQADSSSFKQVVQMLTGSSETRKQPENPKNKNPIPPIRPNKKPASSSKLYERRNNSSKSFKISPLVPNYYPTRPEILSPSVLDFPSLALSPVTPLIPDPFNRSPVTRPGLGFGLDMVAEEKAISKKAFFLHPSPGNTPRESEPRLLPLFPLSSPRLAGSSS